MAKIGTKLGPIDLNSEVSQQRYLVAKSGIELGPVDLTSDVPPSRGI